jgi:hypothetical protein
MLANVKRAMTITATLDRLTFNDADEIRPLFSELIGIKVDESFLLIPPFYTAGGNEIRVGHNVFVNQNCSFYDLGGLHIGDDVLTVSPKRGRARMEAISIAFCIGLVLQSVARHADPWTPESRRGQLLPSVRSDRADRFLPPIAIENLDCQSEDRTVVLPSLPQLSPLCGSGKSPSSRLLTVCIDASSVRQCGGVSSSLDWLTFAACASSIIMANPGFRAALALVLSAKVGVVILPNGESELLLIRPRGGCLSSFCISNPREADQLSTFRSRRRGISAKFRRNRHDGT